MAWTHYTDLLQWLLYSQCKDILYNGFKVYKTSSNSTILVCLDMRDAQCSELFSSTKSVSYLHANGLSKKLTMHRFSDDATHRLRPDWLKVSLSQLEPRGADNNQFHNKEYEEPKTIKSKESQENSTDNSYTGIVIIFNT